MSDKEEVAPVEGEQPESTTGTEGKQPEGENLDGDKPEGTETPADDDAGAPRSKGVERRIGQLTRKYRQAERDKQVLAQKVDALEKRIGPEPAPERPVSTDFKTPEQYEDALFDWRDATTAHKASSTPSTPTPEDQARGQVADKLEADLTVLSETHPDALMIVMDDEWPCSDSTYEFIANSEKGAALAYHLATNIELAKQIDGMSPVLAARELVKVEGELSSPVKPSASPPPPPGTPVTPSGSSVVTDPDKMSAEQWRKWREVELSKRA